MSRKVFEYFFDPEDLEPHYSELPRSLIDSSSSTERRATASEHRANSNENESAPAEPADVAAAESATTGNHANGLGEKSQAEIPRRNQQQVPTGETSDDSSEVQESVAGDAAQVATAHRLSRTRVRRLLSVHALGQYVFCVRSAILAAETGDQRDIDDPLSRFTYLPNFDRERIEEMLSAKITQLAFFLLYGVCLAVLMKMGLAEQNRWVFYPSLIAFLGLACWSLDILVRIFDLALRRRAAIRAEAREPEPTITEIEPVNWWSMLAAGFEPARCQQPFQHPELPLEGAPWRVFERDSRRIPVIKSGSHQLGVRRGELFPKHQVRLVAYALLLEATSHIEVPYGLVFPVDSPHGLAFPITDELRGRCLNLLAEFDQTLVHSQQQDSQPTLPENRNRCSGCDYGKPIPTTPKEIDNDLKAGRQLVVLQSQEGNLYRCQCADRFGSAPPHVTTIRKRLTAVVN